VFAGPCYTNPLHLAQLANLAHPWLRRFPVFLSADEIKSVEDGRHFQQRETGAPPTAGPLCWLTCSGEGGMCWAVMVGVCEVEPGL